MEIAYNQSTPSEQKLFTEIRALIERSRSQVATTVNSVMTMLYWRIGVLINSDVLAHKRAEYGKQVIATIAKQLQMEYGKRAFSEKHLRQMMRFAEVFPDEGIVYTLCREFSWSHMRLLVTLPDELQRDFYIEMCRHEHWSVRALKGRIDAMTYERTAIAKQPEEIIAHDISLLREHGQLTPDMVFHDPYFVDFLGLGDKFSERDLEDAIIAELQTFITELGNDFAFLARQKRITVDNEDYYIDLLFYHRRLRCLVAIDLKLGNFQAAYKGQMELYLRWLDKYDRAEGENMPIGLILCAGKNEEHVELLHLKESNIRVAEYITKLPERSLLEQRLQQAIARAHARLEAEE